MEKSLWHAHLNVCMCVYLGLCGWEGHTFPPMTRQNRSKEGADQSSIYIGRRAGRSAESQYTKEAGSFFMGPASLASPALCQSLLRSVGSVFQRNCLGNHFHLYAVESSPSDFLLLLNPQDAACKFKEFQAPTETPAPTPGTQ